MAIFTDCPPAKKESERFICSPCSCTDSLKGAVVTGLEFDLLITREACTSEPAAI